MRGLSANAGGCRRIARQWWRLFRGCAGGQRRRVVAICGQSFLASSRARIEKRVGGYAVGQDDELRAEGCGGRNIPRYRERAPHRSLLPRYDLHGIEIFSNASGEAAAARAGILKKIKRRSSPKQQDRDASEGEFFSGIYFSLVRGIVTWEHYSWRAQDATRRALRRKLWSPAVTC